MSLSEHITAVLACVWLHKKAVGSFLISAHGRNLHSDWVPPPHEPAVIVVEAPPDLVAVMSITWTLDFVPTLDFALKSSKQNGFPATKK